MPKVEFNEEIATQYDETSAHMFDPAVLEPAVEFLADLAGSGAALEFGVGTGRIALPLAAKGVPVHGIDISEPMLAQLRAKAGAESIGLTEGSFAAAKVDGSFRLAYLVFNTITNLLTQDEQVACFQNAADHLEPGGCFVIEVYVPRIRTMPPGENTRAFDLSPSHLAFDEYTDFAAQIQYSHHYWIEDGVMRNFSAPYRFVWPSELDLMARLAGLRLRERWTDWNRTPFDGESPTHISVWEKPA